MLAHWRTHRPTHPGCKELQRTFATARPAAPTRTNPTRAAIRTTPAKAYDPVVKAAAKTPIDRIDPNAPIDSTEPIEPTERTESTEATDATDRIDPYDPTDRIESFEQTLSIEPLDRYDRTFFKRGMYYILVRHGRPVIAPPTDSRINRLVDGSVHYRWAQLLSVAKKCNTN
ncbi:hypothetical protein Ato02nite_011030 [Paractinoplanes toevensis]|uniref:Uncharacterized protein n=1 Tax=Paractinoplanes toevensis TaxID=571911 RepID=A0A919T5A4_9ACTN|nr:hypothetical protein Ato02nite_011030 [Actinoplanes toevensis]